MEGQEKQITGVVGKGIFEASEKEVKKSVKEINRIYKDLMTKELGTVQ